MQRSHKFAWGSFLALIAVAAVAAVLDPGWHAIVASILADPHAQSGLLLANGAAVASLPEGIKAELSRINSAVELTQGELKARLLDVEQKLARRGGGGEAAFAGGGSSLGSRVEAAFKENADWFAKSRSLTFSVPYAATNVTTTQTGGWTASDGAPLAPGPALAQLIGMLQPGDLAGLTSLHYPRLTGFTGGAAAQDAEGAQKPEASPVFTPITQNAATVAGYATLSEQALNAAGGLARSVDSFLQLSIRNAADSILIAGTAASGWPFTGLVALAATLTPTAAKGWTSIIDAAIAGATHMRLQGFNPAFVVLSEVDYLTGMLAKSTTGEYIFDGVNMSGAGLTLGGMRVALSAGVTAGKALLIDPAFFSYLSSGSVRIALGYNASGDFTKNLITVRGEIEMLPVFSHYQAALLVTPPAT